MAPVIAVECESPSHDTLDTPGLSQLGNLLGDELRSIPRPENTVFSIPEPLSSVLLVSASLLESLVE
jgi:hypothetical protein